MGARRHLRASAPWFLSDSAAIHALGGRVSLFQIGLVTSVGGVTLALALAPSIGWRLRPGTALLDGSPHGICQDSRHGSRNEQFPPCA